MFSHAYEVVFALPDGTIHKTHIQHTSTWRRDREHAQALDSAVLGMIRHSKPGIEVLSAAKLEACGIELVCGQSANPLATA